MRPTPTLHSRPSRHGRPACPPPPPPPTPPALFPTLLYSSCDLRAMGTGECAASAAATTMAKLSTIMLARRPSL